MRISESTVERDEHAHRPLIREFRIVDADDHRPIRAGPATARMQEHLREIPGQSRALARVARFVILQFPLAFLACADQPCQPVSGPTQPPALHQLLHDTQRKRALGHGT
ncbi:MULTISPECIES: hypothetical protein [unclassified Solwaraspora]|uniref:hypothetical protein n=1 Tax=unclassified Solwaraspora TaxID=2627926 RepID=UPI00259B24F1|nr:hypothetical protein [Solwaraspora sp. WMMA2056]WJK38407.1 hypothetical protein O7608_18050 [Solwaraspora sp. WMMA2056]